MPGLGQRRSTRNLSYGSSDPPHDPTSRSLAARGPGVPPVAEHRSHHRLHHHQLCSSAVVGGGALRPPRCLVHDLDEDASVDEDVAEGEGEQGRNFGDVAACGRAAMVRRMTDSRPRSYRGAALVARSRRAPRGSPAREHWSRALRRLAGLLEPLPRHTAGATTMVRGWASTPSSRSCSRSRRTKYAGRPGGAAWSEALAHQCHHHDKVRIVTQAPTSRTRNPLFGQRGTPLTAAGTVQLSDHHDGGTRCPDTPPPASPPAAHRRPLVDPGECCMNWCRPPGTGWCGQTRPGRTLGLAGGLPARRPRRGSDDGQAGP